MVRLGPFRGMRYIDKSIGSAYLPKLLGTYERELGHVVEAVSTRQPLLIVDVGAAEGYYAVGLALRNPQARVVAFESDIAGQAALRRMAELNDVQNRLQIMGACGPSELQSALSTHRNAHGGPFETSFVVCDVEGDERRLLDPALVPSLRRALILTETHEFVCPGITDELIQRFAETHAIDCILQTNRSRTDFPFCGPATWLLPKSYIDWAVSEWRPVRMCWLWMRPHE
jgi:hypothetical protein